MCGLAAVFSPAQPIDRSLLEVMERDLYHRGPDGGGVVAEAGFGLVFRRLAIIDPTSVSDQPMTDRSGRYTIIFNGEIYNFRDLRRQLQAEGVEFLTQSDTEVILQGFSLWGEAIFQNLEGMFAAIIVDRVARRAIAARDPFGIKPLYVCGDGSRTILASEVRPILRCVPAAPDTAALVDLLVYRFAAGRASNFAGISQLPGGSLLEISLDTGERQERQYCNILDSMQPDEAMTGEEALQIAETAIRTSLRQHLESDVGYTLQLSGGVDSSLICALAAMESGHRLKSFSVQLEDPRHDESKWRKPLIEQYGFDHHETLLTARDFTEAWPRAVRAMEGPVPHFGCVMLMLLCETIRQHGKVVLTGEGADEMFGGYQRYALWPQIGKAEQLAALIPGFAVGMLRRYDGILRYRGRDAARHASVYHDVDSMASVFPGLLGRATLRPARRPDNIGADIRSRMIAADQTAYLPSLLMRQDKMAMAASVEARVPFTHWPLARVVNRIPHRLRIPGGETKPLLKKIAEKYLPPDLVHRRKVGLTLPLEEWLHDLHGAGRYLELLTAPDCRLADYADRTALRQAVDDFRAGHPRRLPSMPVLVNLELWLRSLTTSAHR